MRRGSANGKFCAIVQVSIDDAKNAEFEGSSLLNNFNDTSHICVKVRSYLRKLPLHMGAQCALAVDAKVLGYSTETGEYDVLNSREVRYQSGSTENNINSQITAISSNIYEAYFGPETIIRYLNDGAVGGDREIYIMIPRDSLPSGEHVNPTGGFGTSGTNRRTLKANIQVDFVDGSSVPVIIELKRNAVVAVDLSLDKLQIGNQAEDFMQFTPQLKPEYFTENVSPSVIYSFTKYNTTNKAATQNPRIGNAFGGNSTAMPFALPVFNVTNDSSSAFGLNNSATNGASSNGRNYSGLRWVTGTSIPYSNGTSNNYTNDVVAYSDINLGQFFQMDRADNSEGLSASFAGTDNMSWGRKYGTANWFAANGTSGSFSPWITGTSSSNLTNGFGPSLGWHSVSAASGVFYDVGANGAGANHDPGTIYGPMIRTEMTAAFTQHGNMPSSQAMSASPSTNRQVERQFTHSNVNPVDSSLSDVKDSCIPLKDMKTNYFAQGFSIGGGAPIVVCARVVAAGCSAGNSINNRPDIVDSSVYWQHEKANPNGTNLWQLPGGEDIYNGTTDQLISMWANMTNYPVSSGSSSYTPGILTPLATSEAQNNNAVFKYFTNTGGQNRTSPSLTTPKQFVNMPFNGFEYLCNKMFGNSGALHSLDTIPAYTEGYSGTQSFFDDDIVSRKVRSLFATWTLKQTGATYQNVGSGSGSAPFIGLPSVDSGAIRPLYVGPAAATAGQVDNSYHWYMEGYQDVHFIVALGATSKNYSPPQVVDNNVQSVDLCPWYSTDVYIAENEYTYGGSNSPGTGGFKVSQTDFNSGFSDSLFKLVTLYSKQKVPNGSGWQSDDTTVAFRYPYASEHGLNLCKCTDPTLAQGIDNHLATSFNDTISTGFQGNFSSPGFGVNSTHPVEEMFKNALPMDALYTGVAGKGAASPGGAEPCVYATGDNDCLEFIGTDIFISDLDGGLNTNNDGEDGFGGLTVRASIRYRNNCTGQGVDNFKSGFTAQPTAIADILSIWKITYVPGNAGNESVANPQFYSQATVNQVLTADDVISLEINPLSAGSQEYELLVHFQNTQNFMDATSEVQVFPDLPFVRSMPTFNQTYKFNGTTDQVTGVAAGDPTAITQDAFKSRFYNNELTFDSGNSITGGSVRNKFVSSAHTDLNGAAETGASYIPYRSSKLVIEPMSETYAEEGKRVFDFVTYAKFRALSGCTDPGFLNFDPEALDDDGSCAGVSILGCTDENADNYNADATVDDGSCITCSQDLGAFTGFDNDASKFNASTVSAAVNNGSAASAYKILAGYSTEQTTLVGKFAGSLGTQAEGLNNSGTPQDLDTLGDFSYLNQDSYDWFNALRKTGTIVGRTNLPLTNQQYDLTGTTINADYELDIQVVFPSSVTIDSLDDEGFNTFQSAIETPINHRLRLYAATDAIISFITDNNSNDGTGQPTIAEGQQIFFIGEDSNGNPGFNSNTETSSLQAAGFNPTIVINEAAQAFTIESNNLSVARFHVQGTAAQTTTLLTNSTLYVVEHVLLDKSCDSFTSYPAFYSYTMIGLCGCTIDGNDNFPAIQPWQITGSNSYPVAFDNTPCANSSFPLTLGPGDSGQLCFQGDSEITSCDSLYESCFLSVESQCLFDTVDSIDDSDLTQINGSFFVPQETTATILIEGIYNPATNEYEYINQNTGFATQYLNYTINVYIDGELNADLGQAGPSSNDNGDATDSGNGWMHTFTFINATDYQFDIVYTNPEDEGIYAGINLGVECVDTLGPQTIDRTDCEIFPGCTDEEANNFDSNATLDNGSCVYTDCEDLFDTLAGGFDQVNITPVNATSSCETEVNIVLFQEIVNTYVQFNTDGQMQVQVVIDTLDEVFSTQCNIGICPANSVGLGNITNTTDLVNAILVQSANFEIDGGEIPLGNTGQNAIISPLQSIDVPLSGGTSTQFINRDNVGESIETADQTGFTFTGLAAGEYFVFVLPPQSNFTNNSEFNNEECSSEIQFYLDYVSRVTIGSTAPDPACPEDCGNPAGCDDEVYGCTDPDNTEYNEDATVDDGSCEPGTNCDANPTDPACLDCSTEASELIIGSRRKSVTDTEDPCNPSNSGDGCTDPNACNYDPYIDASNSNNQLCDYCSCNEFSEDCCEGEDCGCDPQTDENCPPDVDPECPDPTNPSCNGGGVDPCYDPADCPPPPDPCIILGNCDDGFVVDPPIEEEPVIEIINPVSVPCEPDFLGLSPAATFDFSTVQSAIMRCQGKEGGKMVVKLKHGIEYDEEDLIKLDLITYLFIGGGDKVALPCLFNCNYETRTKRETLEGKVAWAKQGGKKWASTNSYTKGNIVVYYYNTYGATKKSYFRAIRSIEAGGIHPKYKDSGWKLIVDFKPKTVDPLGISDGTEKYLQVMYEFFVRYCSSCEVGGAAALLDPNTEGKDNSTGTSYGIKRKSNGGGSYNSGSSSIIGPDGEEIIF